MKKGKIIFNFLLIGGGDLCSVGALAVRWPFGIMIFAGFRLIGFGAMEITKPSKFIGFGAMDVTKPCKFIGFPRPLIFVSLIASRPNRPS